mgnify:CR=1 FL=1
MARLGMVSQGNAGKAGQGTVRMGRDCSGTAGMESRGEASRGTVTQVRRGIASLGGEWIGTLRQVRRVRVRCGMARQCRLGVAWKGRVRSDLAMQVNFLTGESYGI